MRSIRRHHYQRLKKQSKLYWYGTIKNPVENNRLGKIAETPHPCSCIGCGNPRRHFKQQTKRELMVTVQFDIEADGVIL